MLLVTIANVFNMFIPLFIALALPLIVLIFIIWLIMKIAKANTQTVGKILKWSSFVFVLVIILWSVLSIVSRAITG